MQGDVIGRGENVDPQAEYGYEEHQARSEEQRTGRSIGGSLEGVHSLAFGRLLLSTGGTLQAGGEILGN